MKSYISLPMFVYNDKLNHFLLKFIKKNPQSKKIDFEIEGGFGSFSYDSWNGDVNSNFGDLQMNKDFYNISVNFGFPQKYDCSNIFLEETDFYDVHGNIFLKQAENGSNQIELCDLAFLNELQKKYPQYSYILSKNADIINEFTPEIIDLFTEQDSFSAINLPCYYNNNIEFLKKIKNKSKIELTIGAKCKLCEKEKIKECLIAENKNQILFNNYSVYNNCKLQNNYEDYEEIVETILKLNKLGYSHFRIDAPGSFYIKKFNLYLIYSLIKNEYIKDFFKEYIKEGNSL